MGLLSTAPGLGPGFHCPRPCVTPAPMQVTNDTCLQDRWTSFRPGHPSAALHPHHWAWLYAQLPVLQEETWEAQPLASISKVLCVKDGEKTQAGQPWRAYKELGLWPWDICDAPESKVNTHGVSPQGNTHGVSPQGRSLVLSKCFFFFFLFWLGVMFLILGAVNFLTASSSYVISISHVL